MSDPIAEYVIRAKDDATFVLSRIGGSVMDLRSGLLQMASAGGILGNIGVGLTAMGTAAAVAGISLANNVEQLDRLSAVSGVSVENLQVMQRVLKEGGGDAEGLGPSLVKLNKAIQEGNPLLAKAGITSKDTYTAYMQLAEVLTQTTDAKLRDELATKLLGKAGAELIPDLQNMHDNTKRVREEMERMGSLMTGQSLKAARDLDAQVDALQSSWSDFATSIAKETLPVLAGLAEALAEVARQMTGMARTPEELAVASVGRSVRGVQGLSPQDQVRSLRASQNLQVQNLVQNPGNKMALLMIEAFNRAIAKIEGDAQANARLAQATQATPGGAPKVRFNPNDPATAGVLPYSMLGTGAVKSSLEEQELQRAIDQASQSLSGFKTGMDDLDRSAEATSNAARRMKESFDSLSFGVQADMSAISADVLAGTTTLREAWHQLMQALLRDLTSSAADFGIGLLFDLIPIPGAGAVADKVGGMKATRGGDTYNISALSARDVLQELTSPTGSLRGANDYVRTVSRASRR